MAKAPAFQFYVRDWLTDEHLVKVSFGTKGMWIDLLAYFWLSETRGKTTGTRRELCSMLGCTVKEFRRFLSDNERHPFCDVSCEKGVYTIENRRMVREEAVRAATRNRVRRHREGLGNADCTSDVTPPFAVAVAVAPANPSIKETNWLDVYTAKAKLIVAKAQWHFHGYEITFDKERHQCLFESARMAEAAIPDGKEGEYMERLCARHKPQKILSLIDAFTPAGDKWGLKFVLEAEGGVDGASEKAISDGIDRQTERRRAYLEAGS